MSTKHSLAAARFLENKKNEKWHDNTLWMVRAKRDIQSRTLPRNKIYILKSDYYFK